MLRAARPRVGVSVARTWKSFHVSSAVYAFRKKSQEPADPSIFKRGTPKNKGWVDSFEDTAAYSRLRAKAPKLPEDAPGKEPLSANSAPGQVYCIPDKADAVLRVIGSYRRNQKYELFADRPTLVRESTTVPVANMIKGLKPSKDNRVCVLGPLGVGKSTTLTQAHALAVEQGYIVLHVPRPIELVNGTTDAVYDDSLGHFAQPMYARRWLARIARANREMLSTLPVTMEHKVTAGSKTQNLYELITQGRRKGPAQTLAALVAELEAQTTAPVLFTMDDINVFADHIYSENRSTSNMPIYHGDLQVPHLFLEFLAGKRTFAKGAVMAAVSGSHRMNETILAGLSLTQPSPYAKIDRYDPNLAASFRGVGVLEVPRYSAEEARASLEYWHQAQVIPEEILTESYISQKYFVSGNGNPRELLRACTELYV
uniref:Small ribosomal subunit protein mS29 n=1 Tax=Blastobotrys adeninivorans TaxID=409370 RepID=A0A060THR6_BLAAD